MQYTHLNEETEGQDLRLTSNGADDDEQQQDDEEMGSVALSSLSSKFSRRSRKQAAPLELQQPLHSSATDEDDTYGQADEQEQDPFYVFREDLYTKLDLVEENLTEYLRIVQQMDTAVNTHTVKDSKKQLKRHIKNAESTLKDVQMTVRVVEQQRDKFAHVSSSNLYDRKSLVSTSQERIQRAKQDMNSSSVKSKLLEDERAKQLRRAQQQQQNGNTYDQQQSQNGEGEDTAFIADTAARTSLLMQHQDETLEELDEAVMRVGDMADTIHEEISMQNNMLDELEDDLADAEEKLGLVMGKLAKILKTKDKCQLGTILMLIVTVVVMFLLVVYT